MSSVRNVEKRLLSDNWYRLYKVSFDYQTKDGHWERQEREAYDRGNGATILLYHPEDKTVILTRQFRMPTFMNGNPDGLLIEACAGLLDENDPLTCITLETKEETGFQLAQVEKVMEAYMSPGSVTEILHFFVAKYDLTMKTGTGGGLEHEQEEIEVLELKYEQALEMVKTGEIKDGKTIMLLYHLRISGLL